MPWRTPNVLKARQQFVIRADTGTECFSNLCASSGISRVTGYKWLKRYRRSEKLQDIVEMSRRPHRTRNRTRSDVENEILRLRDQTGGSANRLSALLKTRGIVVAPSTVHRIVRRCKNFDVKQLPSAGWLIQLLLATNPSHVLEREFPDTTKLSGLGEMIKAGDQRERKRALAVIAHLRGISPSVTAEWLRVNRRTVRNYLCLYAAGGTTSLAIRNRPRRVDDESDKRLIFTILHTPPSTYGINRSSWKLTDLHRILIQMSHRMSRQRIRGLIRDAGFRWRKARTVLTSTDPNYKAKVEAIKRILSALREDEAFFSIDEFGPFAIKRRGGLMRIGPAENYVIPQWQKSKGWLIITAALELSRNRLTHFYSLKKNTGEMIKMADLLRMEYRSCKTLYLSWDAASWHISKELYAHLERLNQRADTEGYPILKTAPLPSGSQFLNVIESVFSGMARAVVHNSDYPSVETAKCAINRYFEERNHHFLSSPKRAGRKIWGLERAPSEFSEAHNCKDPRY